MADGDKQIKYEFIAETDNLFRSRSVVNKTTDQMVKSFDKVDKSVKNFNMQTKKTAEAVKRSFGSNLGQAGIQVQQFVGQLQGGQAVMVALAQQSADLGIVLGAPLIGVFVSLAAVLAGTLAPAIFDSKTSLEKLEKAIEQVKVVMTVGANGVANYTEEMERLSGLSRTLTKIKLASVISKQNEAIKLSVTAIKETLDNTRGSFDTYADQIEKLFKVKVGTDNFVKAERALRDYNAAITSLSTGGDVDSLENSLLQLSETGAANTKSGKLLIEQTVELVQKYREGKITIDALNEALDNSGKVQNDTSESASKLILALTQQRIKLEQGERAAFAFQLQIDGLSESKKKAALALYDYNKAQGETAEKIRNINEELDDFFMNESEFFSSDMKERIKDVNDELDRFFENEKNRSEAKQAQRDVTLTRQIETIGATPLEEIEARYKKELDLLKEAEQRKLLTETEFAEKSKQLQIEKQNQINASVKNGFGLLGQQIGVTNNELGAMLTNVITGSQDGEDALKGLARTMITQVVGAAVQYGIELVKNRILGQALATSQQANIAATTSAGIASQQAATASTVTAATTTAAAAAPAAALTSTFSFGSAAIIGGAALLGTLAIAKMMGNRQYGGPVSSGMYRVNETGSPEVYSYGGKDYLMNTKNANIRNLEQGGGGGMTVNISNNTPYEVFVTQDQAAQIANIQIGREAGKAAKGQGQMLKGLQQGTQLKSNARR